ncbi:MAG: hypothetical protein OFPI_19190 [Osedax symbiont Rs2]|nr:MAG: hypothetical protein OFPI_19190 [Osedax symbiont Rs2]
MLNTGSCSFLLVNKLRQGQRRYQDRYFALVSASMDSMTGVETQCNRSQIN